MCEGSAASFTVTATGTGLRIVEEERLTSLERPIDLHDTGDSDGSAGTTQSW
ncbi:MAG: hypothetical protein U5K79_22455 [Cyclobacteriaceae bacterium]|nr:hypothetical protein [Cyclobacteriaceae bacterium]